MKRSHELLLAGLLIGCIAFGTHVTGLAQSTTAPAPKSAPTQPQTEAEHGERAFKANCSRCHYAPDTLNPRITGTVIRHMRVRANLSAADERAILRYLNP
jgi:cytochrome c2